MIGHLTGKILFSDEKKILLKTSYDIGYEVNYAYFAQVGDHVEVYVHHHITESDQSLWGFKNLEDKKTFELLKSVNKVGASKAYVLLTQIGRENILNALTFEQKEVLTQASGIGKKMAEQIILSLKDKVSNLSFSVQDHSPTISNNLTEKDNRIVAEAILALESLGYNDKSLHKTALMAMNDNIKSSEDLIKSILKDL